MSSDKREFSDSQVFNILSSARRRYVIYYLRKRDEEVPLTELASQVAAWEYETDPDELTDQQEKRVYVSLYQTHLPKLAELGIVDYDRERGVVSLTKESRTLNTHLRRNEDQEPPWQFVYLTLAAIGVLALVAAVQDVSVFAAIDEGVLGMLVAVAFGLTAGAQLLYQRRLEPGIPEELQLDE